MSGAFPAPTFILSVSRRLYITSARKPDLHPAIIRDNSGQPAANVKRTTPRALPTLVTIPPAITCGA